MSESTDTLKAPKAIREARVVIIGAGPTGCFAAAKLNKLGVRTTILERQPRAPNFDISKTYCFALNIRGLRSVETVPGLLPCLLPEIASEDGYTFAFIKPDGSVAKPSVDSFIPGFKPGMMVMRPMLTNAFRKFVDSCSYVNTIYDANVNHIETSDAGNIAITYESDGQ